MALDRGVFKGLLLSFLALALLALSALFSASSGASRGSEGPVVDSLLRDRLAELGSGEVSRAIITYDGAPSRSELEEVRQTGVAVHTFDALPMVGIQGTKTELRQVLSLQSPVSVYADKRLEYLLRESRPLVGADRVESELGFTGEGVGVAVVDTGVDGTHEDLTLGEELVQNVKIVGAPALDDGPSPLAVTVEDVAITDTSSGHGTHVSGTVGGSGQASDGYYTGIAPEADVVGIGAGDVLFILNALEAFDYALEHQKEYNIQVISNSWGTTGAYDPKDPVNVASRVAYERGITSVFAAGNGGPGQDTLNPYSVAPWVIGVAAGDKQGKLADFSSRGRPGSDLYHPDLTAPGVNIVSARAKTGSTINALTAADDATYVPPEHVANYTTASGTSMATPHVSGTVALMEQANPALTPNQTLQILTQTADPMSGYEEFEAGAGYLNAYNAVQAAQ